MTNFHKPFGQNMHRKTADKLLVAQNHLLFDAFLAVIFVIEGYIFSINFSDSLVADCDFVGITTQIFGLPNGFLAKTTQGFSHRLCLILVYSLRFLSFNFSQNLALKTLLKAFTENKNLPSLLMFFQAPLSSTPPPGTMQCKCG